MKTRQEKTVPSLAVVLAVVVTALYAASVWYGDLNQDEGWYLYAGRLVSDGLHPFFDFAFTQGPVMAYVYGITHAAVAVAGVLGGRVVTAVLGMLTVLIAARLAARLAGTRPGERLVAGALTAGLLGLNLYHVYFTSLVKTYGLAGVLTVLAFWSLTRAVASALEEKGDRRDGSNGFAFGFAALAAGWLALSAGVRLSAGVFLPAVWLTLAFSAWRDGRIGRKMLPVLLGLPAGGTLVLALVYAPFLIGAPDALGFGLLAYHAGRQAGDGPMMMIYKAGFLLRLAGSYFPMLILGVVAVLAPGADAVPASDVPADRLRRLMGLTLGCGALAATVVHLAAPFPYDDYQVFVMPVVAVPVALAAAGVLTRLPVSAGRRFAILAGALVLMLAHSASSPLVQTWATLGRDRIWWPLRSESPLQGLRRVAVQLRERQDPSEPAMLLTQDAYLAVETGWRVPPGMELGPFCFFPGLDDEQAERWHVLNENRLLDLIENGTAEWAAFSAYGLAIRAPDIVPVDPDLRKRLEMALDRHYDRVTEIPHFGQGATRLRIYKKRGSR